MAQDLAGEGLAAFGLVFRRTALDNCAQDHEHKRAGQENVPLATELFLTLKGYGLRVDDAECTNDVLALADGSMTESGLCNCLRSMCHLIHRTPPFESMTSRQRVLMEAILADNSTSQK